MRIGKIGQLKNGAVAQLARALEWGISSVGRALQWHCRGHQFESDILQ